MGALIQSVLMYAAVIVLIVAGFRLYKNTNYVKIEPGDSSMAPELVAGNYKTDRSLTKSSELKTGDVVAYFPSSQPGAPRVGRVIAVEGQRLTLNDGSFEVDGVAVPFKTSLTEPAWAGLRLPRGCVFVLTKTPTTHESMKEGPVPLYQILGKVEVQE